MSRSEVDVVDESRRPWVFGALASALPDRVSPRRDRSERVELRVVAPAHRRRRNWQVGTVAGLMLFVALFLVAGAQTLIVQQQGHLDDLNEKIDVAEQDAARLQIERTEGGSPERITNEAETRLGMVAAAEPVYLQPRPDDDVRAAEVPPTSPPTTASPITTPTTAAKATPATTAPKATTATGAAKATTPTSAPKASTPTTIGAGSGR